MLPAVPSFEWYGRTFFKWLHGRISFWVKKIPRRDPTNASKWLWKGGRGKSALLLRCSVPLLTEAREAAGAVGPLCSNPSHAPHCLSDIVTMMGSGQKKSQYHRRFHNNITRVADLKKSS